MHVFNLYFDETNRQKTKGTSVIDLVKQFINCEIKVLYRSIRAQRLYQGEHNSLSLVPPYLTD